MKIFQHEFLYYRIFTTRNFQIYGSHFGNVTTTSFNTLNQILSLDQTTVYQIRLHYV